jgi:hypothetical protein
VAAVAALAALSAAAALGTLSSEDSTMWSPVKPPSRSPSSRSSLLPTESSRSSEPATPPATISLLPTAFLRMSSLKIELRPGTATAVADMATIKAMTATTIAGDGRRTNVLMLASSSALSW